MTKPTPPAVTGEVVEIDAMDVGEWEQHQRTPQASDANLAALVKESASRPEPAMPEAPRTASLVSRRRVTEAITPQPARLDSPAIAHPHPPPGMRPGARPGAQPDARPDARPGARPDARPGARPGARSNVRPGTSPAVPPGASLDRSGEAELEGRDRIELASPVRLGRAGSPTLERTVPPAASAPAMPVAAPTTLNDILGRVAPQAEARPDGIVLPLQAPAESAAMSSPGRGPAPATSPDGSEGRPESDVRAVREWRELGQVPPASMERGDPDEPREADLRRRWLSPRRLLALGGAAGAAGLVAVVLALQGGAPPELPAAPAVEDPAATAPGPETARPSAPVAKTQPAPSRARAERSPASSSPSSSPPSSGSSRTGAARPELAAPAADEPTAKPSRPSVGLALPSRRSASSEPPSARARHVARKLAGKKVVVDYAERSNEVPAPGLVAQAAEDPAIGRARTAYLRGNQQLFDGDADGAIRAYREALEVYPGYVGGYRGLGLAYAQLGDHRQALEAFEAYIAAVPGARDVALIKKRIAHLHGK